MPECAGGTDWKLLIDTNIAEKEEGMFATGDTYDVTGRSLLMFALEATEVGAKN